MESEVNNEILNIGSGKSTTIKELAFMLKDLLDVDIKPEFEPRDVLVTERRADVSKIKELLDFEAAIEISDGLKEVVEDIKTNPDRY
jgi:UDP-glucose 4-epimerase